MVLRKGSTEHCVDWLIRINASYDGDWKTALPGGLLFAYLTSIGAFLYRICPRLSISMPGKRGLQCMQIQLQDRSWNL